MTPEVFRQMAEVQDRHWWFVARRRIIDAIVRSLRLPTDARLLELGCGTGANLAMLARHGQLQAMEYDADARAVASRLGHCPVDAGGLPDHLPYPPDRFDLVCLLDVLEHVADDAASLAAVARLLRPGGRVLLTVPAYAWLWSAHDVSHHHHRRYTRSQLVALAQASGLQVERAGYFNTLLFPLVAGVRLATRLIGRDGGEGSDARLPGAPLNALLQAVFALERHVVPRWPLPFGVSAVAVLRRPE